MVSRKDKKEEQFERLLAALYKISDRLEVLSQAQPEPPSTHYYHNPNIVGNVRVNRLKMRLSNFFKTPEPSRNAIEYKVEAKYKVVELNGGVALMRDYRLLGVKGAIAETKLDVYFYPTIITAVEAKKTFIDREVDNTFAKQQLDWWLSAR